MFPFSERTSCFATPGQASRADSRITGCLFYTVAVMSEPSTRDKVEKLGTPELLDRALYVTTPKEWLALLALTVMLGAAVAWAVMGEISTYVRAQGIFISRGGMIQDVVAPAPGRLARIVPEVGADVEEGSLIAEISDAETLQRYHGAVAFAKESALTLKVLREQAREENEVAADNLTRQRVRLDELEATGRTMVESLEERLREDREMLRQGFADRGALDQTEQSLDLARRNLFDVLRRRDDIESTELRRKNSLEAMVTAAEADYLAARNRVGELEALLDSWRVEAPVSGRVIERKAQLNSIVHAGQPLLGIETAAEGIDVLVYVSPVDGKRVEADMPVLVSPAPYRRERFGSLTGVVENIAEFPSSLEGMIAVLRNEELARTFSESGPPYPGRVALTADASTASGFAWTSPRATDLEITAGTLAEIEIEVDNQPPMALVVPWVRETFGL